MTDDEATRRWREWSATADDSGRNDPPMTGTTATGTQPGEPGRRFTARAMGWAGSSMIAALAVLLTGLSALPQGLGHPPSPSSSSLEPARTGTDPERIACVEQTKNLLCEQQASDFDNRNTLRTASISAAGPGTLGSSGLTHMIDGKPETSWMSTSDITGATITVRFRHPVTLGEVGFESSTSSSRDPSARSAARRVLNATWSFARLNQDSDQPCDDDRAGSGTPFRQAVDWAPLIRVVPGDTTCTVRIHIDRISAAEPGRSGFGQVGIDEILLRAP